MSDLRSRLPSPGALIAFEAVARRLSFTRAAGELGISQAAVSRQVRILEDHLGGVLLLNRSRRQVRLTPAGEQLFDSVAMGLNHIAGVADTLRRSQRDRSLTVATSIAFSTFWLIRHLARFHNAHPQIEVRLITSDAQADWHHDDVDAAVVYGRGDAPGARAYRLFSDEIIAVAHPDLFAGRSPGVADLAEAPLLHQDSPHETWLTWPQWLRRNGAAAPAQLRGPRFTNHPIVMQAARDGHGVALGWRHLIAPDLAGGDLVRVTDGVVVPDEAYFLLVPDRLVDDRKVRAFRDWIVTEIARDDPAKPPPRSGRSATS